LSKQAEIPSSCRKGQGQHIENQPFFLAISFRGLSFYGADWNSSVDCPICNSFSSGCFHSLLFYQLSLSAHPDGRNVHQLKGVSHQIFWVLFMAIYGYGGFQFFCCFWFFFINLYAVNAKSTWLNNLKLCFSVNQWKIHTFDNCSIIKSQHLLLMPDRNQVA
jgi:hypothetical protein